MMIEVNINEERLQEIESRLVHNGCFGSKLSEMVVIMRLAKLGLEYESLIDQENGKANLMALLDMGRRYKHGDIDS
jgi:hypothetical protein